MLTVHHLENSRSQRVLWLLEELGAAYEVRRYERDPKTMLAPPELEAVHPLGKSPVITDGDVTVAETGAIVEYLIDRYGEGRLRPEPGTPERLRYTYWLHAAEGTFMPVLVMKLVMSRLGHPPIPWLIRPIAKKVGEGVQREFTDPRIDASFAFAERELGKSTWFAGEALTGADIMMSFPCEALMARAAGAGRYPRVAAFVDRVHARPAYQRALERGGPYALLG
ncbi:MAG: glutathione S-transferase [Myxococcales bacterium]|nr:glutathione S-transferase [Myxococcales bacterium]